jgi:hypothetical protein
MYKAVCTLALAASATAFAPLTSLGRASSAVKAVENELGAIPPLGFWDPLGFTADGDMEAFTRRRAVEIKHGRICMLAAMGMLFTHGGNRIAPDDAPWLGGGYLAAGQELKYSDIQEGIYGATQVPLFGWIQILVLAGFVEVVLWPAWDYSCDYGTGFPPGAWTPFGTIFKGKNIEDPVEKADKLNKEITNGRLAMIGTIGMMLGDGIAPGTSGMPTADGIGFF